MKPYRGQYLNGKSQLIVGKCEQALLPIIHYRLPSNIALIACQKIKRIAYWQPVEVNYKMKPRLKISRKLKIKRSSKQNRLADECGTTTRYF